MLAPAEAQAPAMIDNSQGWSVARMVSSVTPRASSKPTLMASLWPARSLARPKPAGKILRAREQAGHKLAINVGFEDRKSTRLHSQHHNIEYAVFCLKKKKNI